MDEPIVEPVDELEQQLRQGSFFVQASLEQQGRLVERLDAWVTALLDVLVESGTVDIGRVGEVVDAHRRRQAEERAEALVADHGLGAWPTVVVRAEDPDDAPEPAVEVDCAARLPICRAACCSLRFALSAGEVEDGRVKWDLGHPYLIRQTTQGWCVHNDRATGGCAIYGDRPRVCRAYSCAGDTRIWKDFDNMVLNEEYLSTRVPARFRFRPSSEGAVPVHIGGRRERPAVAAGG
jgi:Fe-S-cluster containining protein